MAKKTLEKTTKKPAPDAGANRADSAYPAEPQELHVQRQRLKKAAAMAAEALKSSPPAGPADLNSSPAAVSPSRLAPLAVLRPTPARSQGASKPSQAPARKARPIPVEAAPPQASNVPAAQPDKPPTQRAAMQSPGKAAAVAEAPEPAAPQTVKVTFVLLDLGAKQVSVGGDFNNWASNATPMKRDDAGHWETTIELAPGRYQYKFIVDGQWIPDPLAHEQVWNDHGTLNSVIEVRA